MIMATVQVIAYRQQLCENDAGRNVDFLRLLDEAVEPEARAKLLGCLLRADKAGVAAIGRDESCMEAFASWLEELIPHRTSFHVLELLLKVISYCACERFQKAREPHLALVLKS